MFFRNGFMNPTCVCLDLNLDLNVCECVRPSVANSQEHNLVTTSKYCSQILYMTLRFAFSNSQCLLAQQQGHVGDGQPGRDKCRMILAPSDCEAQSPAHWERKLQPFSQGRKDADWVMG
jgi:hypothetical protein